MSLTVLYSIIDNSDNNNTKNNNLPNESRTFSQLIIYEYSHLNKIILSTNWTLNNSM